MENLDFYRRVDIQRQDNIAKYGTESIEKLLLVCQEQLGQLVGEHLANGVTPKFRTEIIHLAAVLPTIYEQAK